MKKVIISLTLLLAVSAQINAMQQRQGQDSPTKREIMRDVYDEAELFGRLLRGREDSITTRIYTDLRLTNLSRLSGKKGITKYSKINYLREKRLRNKVKQILREREIAHEMNNPNATKGTKFQDIFKKLNFE